jgi:hypothetical protein
MGVIRWGWHADFLLPALDAQTENRFSLSGQVSPIRKPEHNCRPSLTCSSIGRTWAVLAKYYIAITSFVNSTSR